jgi:hypothetical protein
MDRHREAEVKQVYAPEGSEQGVEQPAVVAAEAITGQANISTDGGMVLIREEGWKEVKMTTVSQAEVQPLQVDATFPDPAASSCPPDPQVQLHHHSYQAGLWDADQMGRHQYVEGLRRGIDGSERLSSVNDGAPWIARITGMNFPQAVQIVDWQHAKNRLWAVANTVFGERTPRAKRWIAVRLDHLWEGQTHRVVKVLEELDLDHQNAPDEVRQSPGYFNARREKMDYAAFRQQGFPIGSGTVESGINCVVHHRMKRPGRGWKRENAQAMLAGLSALHSGRFDRLWQTAT